jgi:glucose/arabinose dehydrogenase
MMPGTNGIGRQRFAFREYVGISLILASVLLPKNFSSSAADEPARPKTPPYLNMPRQRPVEAGRWLPVPAFPALTFQFPTLIIGAPRSNLLFVGEVAGVVKCFANDPNAKEAVTVLDIRHQCQAGSDAGLLGLAFHPDFGKSDSPNRGHFYVFYNYTDSPAADVALVKATWNRLSRFTIPDGALTADLRSEMVLIDQKDEDLAHNGGAMFFHPDDRFLYVALGDEGHWGGFLYGNCQRIDKDLFSGVIRIDVDMDPSRSHPPPRQPETGKTAHYFIPNDNPFVGVPNALEEFWCIGLRNPHRMSYDAVSKRIWLGDVGQGGDPTPCEEINLIVKGGNYQWNYSEGGALRSKIASRPSEVWGVEQPPIHAYAHAHAENRRCVIGGYVYRGKDHDQTLGGKYIFGDLSGLVWTMDYHEGKEPIVKELCVAAANRGILTSFGTSHDGELYLCMSGGAILKLAQAGTPAAPLPSTGQVPRLLSQTGAFRDAGTLVPAPGLIPYDVNAPFFSDNVEKQRWMSLPFDPAGAGNAAIGFSPKEEWTFPPGTVFVKHFEMPSPTSGAARRLETRLLVLDEAGGAYGVTYKWRPDGSDADLLSDAVTERLPQGQDWLYPSSASCLVCHNSAVRYVLGVNARQLNRKNQLQRWNRLKLFDRVLADQELVDCGRLANLDDASASLEEKAHSYLDVNCAYCHRPAGVRAYFDARYETPLKQKQMLHGPVFAELGVAGAQVLIPGDPDRSLLLQRITYSDVKKMPPLGRSLPDAAAIPLLEEWIRTMPPVPVEVTPTVDVTQTEAAPRRQKPLLGKVLIGTAKRLGVFVAVGLLAWLWRCRLEQSFGMIRMAPWALASAVPLAMVWHALRHPSWGWLEAIPVVSGVLCLLVLLAFEWRFRFESPNAFRRESLEDSSDESVGSR